ncbi:hypothetical protein M404DRAFT_999538, partial [Pisolithus tinctorius Marx 270]
MEQHFETKVRELIHTAWKQFPSQIVSRSPVKFLVAKRPNADRDGNTNYKYPIPGIEWRTHTLESSGMRCISQCATPVNM